MAKPEKKLQELKTRLLEVGDLNNINALLNWDQQTYMPPGGAEARGRQSALMAQMAQEKFIDKKIGKLLDDLRPYEESLAYDSDDASLIRVTRRNYERALKIPPKFIGELNEHGAKSYQEWTEARPANDFSKVRGSLEKTLDLSRQLADYFPGYEHIADPLIDFADYGMKASSVRTLFADLRDNLVPIVRAITSQPPADDSVLHKHYPEAEQLSFGTEVVRQLGYDFNRGRIDKTHHPFMTKFSLGDVRITTRVKEDDFGDCLFSNMHEAGHAMYEQGIDMSYEACPSEAEQARVCMNRNQGFGKISSAEVTASGNTCIPNCSRISPRSSMAFHSMRSMPPSTKLRSRSSVQILMRSPTICM